MRESAHTANITSWVSLKACVVCVVLDDPRQAVPTQQKGADAVAPWITHSLSDAIDRVPTQSMCCVGLPSQCRGGRVSASSAEGDAREQRRTPNDLLATAAPPEQKQETSQAFMCIIFPLSIDSLLLN